MTPGDDAPATRADFLRDLAGHGFAPPEGWPLLANDRLGSALPVTPDASAALDASLAVAVDGFAAEFWELPPSERRERWAGLSARGGDRATTSFLAHLKRGLNEVARPDPDPVADELAGIARELFVLRPRPRAVRRTEWLIEKAGDGTDWEATRRVLGAAAPAAAQLDPGLVTALTRWNATPRAVPTDRPPRVADYRRPVAASKPGRGGKNAADKPTRVGVWVTVAVILFGLKALVLLGRSATSAPDPKPPAYRYTPPPINARNVPELRPPGYGFTPPPVPPWGGVPAGRDMLDKMRGNQPAPFPPPFR